jgi:hypothetical protein
MTLISLILAGSISLARPSPKQDVEIEALPSVQPNMLLLPYVPAEVKPQLRDAQDRASAAWRELISVERALANAQNETDKNALLIKKRELEERIVMSNQTIDEIIDKIDKDRQATALAEAQAIAEIKLKIEPDKKLPEIRFDKIPLTDVIEFMKDITGYDISVNWAELKTIGINQDTAVTMRVRDATIRQFLEALCKDLGGAEANVGVVFGTYEIRISTSPDLAKNTTTRPFN